MEKKLTNSGPLREPADKHSIYTIKILFGMHIAPCGRAYRGQYWCPSRQPSLGRKCLNLHQKKCKFLYDAHNRPSGGLLVIDVFEGVSVAPRTSKRRQPPVIFATELRHPNGRLHDTVIY